MSALLLWQIEPLCHFQKRFGGLDQGRGSEALEDQLGNQESDGLLSHDHHHQYEVTVNINYLITVNVLIIFIISSSLAVMTMTVKKTEKRQQKFFTNQVGSLKPQSR